MNEGKVSTLRRLKAAQKKKASKSEAKLKAKLKAQHDSQGKRLKGMSLKDHLKRTHPEEEELEEGRRDNMSTHDVVADYNASKNKFPRKVDKKKRDPKTKEYKKGQAYFPRKKKTVEEGSMGVKRTERKWKAVAKKGSSPEEKKRFDRFYAADEKSRKRIKKKQKGDKVVKDAVRRLHKRSMMDEGTMSGATSAYKKVTHSIAKNIAAKKDSKGVGNWKKAHEGEKRASKKLHRLQGVVPQSPERKKARGERKEIGKRATKQKSLHNKIARRINRGEKLAEGSMGVQRLKRRKVAANKEYTAADTQSARRGKPGSSDRIKKHKAILKRDKLDSKFVSKRKKADAKSGQHPKDIASKGSDYSKLHQYP